MNYIDLELANLATKISKETTLFMIGGLALIQYGLKAATKDIDIVVGHEEELHRLINSLEQLGYRSLDNGVISKAYKEMETARILENSDGFRWDIFYRQICGALILTREMARRAKNFYKEKFLTIKIVSKEDIFLFKGITERETDLNDMRLLAETGLDWAVIKEECRIQSELTGRLWENALLGNLQELRSKYRIKSPIEKVLEKIVEEKLMENAIVRAVVKGNFTMKMVSKEINVPVRIVSESVIKMEKKGILKIEKGSHPYKLISATSKAPN